MHRAVAVVLLTAPVAIGSAQAQRVEATASVDSTRIGERFLLTVSALHGFEEAPEFPNPQQSTEAFGEDLEDIRVVSAGRTALSSTAWLDSIVFNVTTFALDSAVVPPLKILFHSEAQGDSTARLVIPVLSVVPANADTIRPMTEAVPFPQSENRGIPLWLWILLAIVILILGGAGWMWYTRKRTEVVPGSHPPDEQPPPFELAMARLRKLESTDLGRKGSEPPYFVELSEIVRMYLEHRIDIPALELTTGEVLEEFSHVRYKIPGGIPDEIRSVLGLSDLVKFAEYIPSAADSAQALAQARHAIERLEEKQRQLALDEARHSTDQD